MRDSDEKTRQYKSLAGRDDLGLRAAAPNQARRGRCRAEEQNHRDGQHDEFLQVWNHGRGSGRIGHAHPAPFMVNVVLPCAFNRWGFRKMFGGVRSASSGREIYRRTSTPRGSIRGAALATTGFSTCPHRRHSRRAPLFTMFMPHFGHGGRTSKQVNAMLLVRQELCSFRLQAWWIVWWLWIAIAIKRHGAMDRFATLYCSLLPELRRELRVK